MLNTILLFVLTYIIITIFVNLMIFYVNDEFKDLNKFNLFYFIIVYIFSSFTLGIYIHKASKFEKNNNEDDETFLHLIEFGNEDMENSSFYSGFKVSDYRNLDIFWNDT